MGAANSSAAVELGQVIRSRRKEKGYTLDEVNKLTGVAKSTISKIENNLISPSFETVQSIAKGLCIDLPQLFSRTDNRPQPVGRIEISRAEENSQIQPTSTYEHRLLGSKISNKKLFPYVTTVKARSKDEYPDWVRHDGEEFLYVLKGSLIFYSEFYEPIELHKGDSTYYDCAMGHNLVSISEEDAEVLWVTA